MAIRVGMSGAQEHQLGAPVSVGQREPLDHVRALRSSVVTFGY